MSTVSVSLRHSKAATIRQSANDGEGDRDTDRLAVEVRGAELDQDEQPDGDGQAGQADGDQTRSGSAPTRRAGGAAVDIRPGLSWSKPSANPNGGVDDEVDPQHLRRGERLAVGDVEQARAEEGQDEHDQQDQDEPDVLA